MTASARVGAVLLILVVAVGAQGPATPTFRHERLVELLSGTAHRLDIDVTLLAGSRPFAVTSSNRRRTATGGLDDLRFYDASGREVPYLLVPPPFTEPVWQPARVLPVAQTEKTSGFEADLGEPATIDAVRVSGIAAPFLKRVVIEGSGDRERWTMLVAEGTLFDLPAERLEQTTAAFTPGSFRYVRFTWDDAQSGRVGLPATVAARRVPEPLSPAPALRASLAAERRPSEPGVSRFRIRLPAASLPIVELDLTVGGGHVLREARVSEARLDGDQATYHTIGSATLRRVVRNGISADALRIPISPPREALLELVVDDGDNPPLDLRMVTAVLAELPWIYVEHEPGTFMARYGDPQLQAPQYDLEAARASVAAAHTSQARWGEVRAAAPVAAVEVGAPMPETGAVLESGSFKYSRTIPPGSGLVTVPLDAAVLAHSGALRSRFADVRVLDDGGRQIPYLVECRNEPIAIDLRVEARDLPTPVARRHQGRTSYAVQLPYQRLPGARLVLHTRARIFRRGVTFGLLVPPTERHREWQLDVLSSTMWQHANEDAPARGLVVDLPESRRGEIVFIVDEGDNQRLSIEKATLLLPSYALRFYRPADRPLRLVYGREDLGAPSYDLALLAPRVMGALAQEVYPEREQPAGGSAAAATIVSPPVFWASLGLAVVVLLGLIVRLVRRDEGAASV